jgi:sortase (surface protein transpeptidase)
MDVPTDPARAGWYDLGPAPGSLGPAVIAGHVTWNGTRAVFFALATLRHGDLVRVDRADGRRAVFAVRRVARFQKTHFPTREIYGPIDHAGLRLITCGGTYDASAHRYLANVVVFADLVGTGPPR